MQLMFRQGRVARIAYAGEGGGVNPISGGNEFCAPLVSECVCFAQERQGTAPPPPPPVQGRSTIAGDRTDR